MLLFSDCPFLFEQRFIVQLSWPRTRYEFFIKYYKTIKLTRNEQLLDEYKWTKTVENRKNTKK